MGPGEGPSGPLGKLGYTLAWGKGRQLETGESPKAEWWIDSVSNINEDKQVVTKSSLQGNWILC